MQRYSVIRIDDEPPVTVPFEVGVALKAIVRDDRGHKLLQLGLDWVRIIMNQKGRSIDVAWSGGTGKPAA